MTLRLFALLLATSCGVPQPVEPPPTEPEARVEVEAPQAPAARTITIVGTNDLHGHLRALPILAGYLRILRELRREDGGVVLLDGGDMFQGTLESNLLEGSPIVAAYGVLGYDAVTIGNHEFDYGPVGERATPASPADDPRGALLARAAEARFPILSANLRMREGGAPIDWDHVAPSALIEKAGVRIGVIGVTTEATLRTTISANVRDLAMEPLVQAIVREAASLRERGASVVVVAAHAGGACESFDDPVDLTSCRPEEEIFQVARALPASTVDAIVAGHTHRAVAHVVNGIPIVESHAYGRAFGRIDLRIVDGRVDGYVIHPPQDLCVSGRVDNGDCVPAEYEDHAIETNAEVAALIEPAIENARTTRERSLEVTVESPIRYSWDEESPLGNLFTELMLAARPNADAALTNGGSLRATLPVGPLTYGELYEAMPFDNYFALVRMSAGDLATILQRTLSNDGSFFSVAGVRAEARCEGGHLQVRLLAPNGRPMRPDRTITVVTSDFLATGGDGAIAGVQPDAVTIEEGVMLRDGMADALRRRGGTLRAEDLHDPHRPRVRYEGERPVRCH